MIGCFVAHVSNTPTYIYLVMLLVDFLVATWLSLVLVDYFDTSSHKKSVPSCLDHFMTCMKKCLHGCQQSFNRNFLRRNSSRYGILGSSQPSSYNSTDEAIESSSPNDPDDPTKIVVLQAVKILKSYKASGVEAVVLSNISLQLSTGLVYTLLGSNGMLAAFDFIP